MSRVEISRGVEGESTLNGRSDHFEGLGYPDPSIDDRVALSVNGRTPISTSSRGC